jgi:hypothetical protein
MSVQQADPSERQQQKQRSRALTSGRFSTIAAVMANQPGLVAP